MIEDIYTHDPGKNRDVLVGRIKNQTFYRSVVRSRHYVRALGGYALQHDVVATLIERGVRFVCFSEDTGKKWTFPFWLFLDKRVHFNKGHGDQWVIIEAYYEQYEGLDVTYNPDNPDEHKINQIKTLFNGKEANMDFDLSNYKPEKVKDNDFEVITGKGFICKVNSARIEDVDGGENDRGKYEAYTRLKYELEIISEKNKSRRLWKSYNLSSKEKTGKAEKTPIQKLADAFFTIGLEFSNSEQLNAVVEKFAEMELVVSCSKFKPKGGDTLQLHTITALAAGEAVGAVPDTKVEF